jgi:hypothetical protein
MALHRIFHPYASAPIHLCQINDFHATVAGPASPQSQRVPVLTFLFITGQLRVDRIASD